MCRLFIMHVIICKIPFLIVLEVYFSQTMYSVNESNPIATVTLKASSVRQSNYNVVVSVKDGTARGEYLYTHNTVSVCACTHSGRQLL